MKRILKLMVVISACWLITACGTNGTSPSGMVEKTLNAFIKMDFETVKKCLTENRIERFEERAKNLLEDSLQTDKFRQMAKDASYKIVSEKISDDGNSAAVVVSMTFMQNGKLEEDVDEMKLILVNGEWKI
ncbi:MAG: DUF4878 domain-containing protein, partial [Prevotellaceae bacterium]|nr:DUF4878 domain-containing protein [Prevotellaceae bacterium]